MATDQEISQALHSLLRDSFSSASSSSSSSSSSSPNPNKPPATAATFTSFADVVQQLESRLGTGLSHKVEFIRSQIQLLFQPQPHPPPPPPQLHQTYPLLHRNDHFGLQQSPHFYPQAAAVAAVPSAFHGFPAQYTPTPHPAPPPRPVDPPKESAPPKAKRKGGAGGLNKLCGVTPELQAVVGHPALPRTEIVKQLWAYIRKNNLQDPSNKRKIICNDELRLVFETDCTDMFKMNKLLSKHIIPLDPNKEPASKKPKAETEAGTRVTEPGPAVEISDALAKLFGVDEREMLLTEIDKRIWEYINVNQLQDPRDRMVIQCDEKLQEIFGCESFHASGMSEILKRQYVIRS